MSISKQQLLDSLKEYIIKNGFSKLYQKTFVSKNGLSSFTTYTKMFGNDLTYIIELCGINLTEGEKHIFDTRCKKSNKSKEEITKIIYAMQKILNRPLQYEDFRNPTKDTIGITEIRNHFGTMNKMKSELGLEIIQESMMDKTKPIIEMKSDLIRLCNEILKKENRKVITIKDIDRCEYTVNSNSYRKYLKLEYLTIGKFLDSIGFQLQKEGNGLNHTFENGEKVRSQYELDFSKLLREKLKLQYGKDYFRDVRYKEFIPGYKGLLDCDYIINYNSRKIYIEIAGMLRDNKLNFINNIVINSNSKEKYRQHLILKDKMFKDNNLEYYILFPSDLQEDFLLSIFNSSNN